MPILNKTKNTAAIYNRGREVVKVYDHGKLAWQKSTAIPGYLCFTALEAGQFTLTIPAAVTHTYLSYVEWSKDGRTWNHTDNTSGEVVTIQVDVTSGDKVYWRGKAQRYTTSTNNYSCFSSDCRFTAKGVLKSLLFAEDFVTHVDGTWTSVYNYALSQLFRGCTTLIDASELILPSGHLAVAQLLGLFRDCTNLVRGADLPATGVNGSTYYWLYYNCTSLERLPNIAATTITDISGGNGNYAFYYAFYDCTSMTGSVTLNLTQVKGKQLFDSCFWRCKISSVDITMQSYDLQGVVFRNCFNNCTNLNHVRCTIDPSLATSDDFQNWLLNVSSTGTFIQADGVTWSRGASGIPNNWTIETQTP